MIKLILGGIGSGKSLSAVRFIKRSRYPVFVNFNVFGLKNAIRLKWSDIIKNEVNDRGKVIKSGVNWEFWDEQREKYGNFHIIIDEIHNIMHSRRSMSKNNVILSEWVSQIRKICGSSEETHLIIISQEENKVDIDVKNLAYEIIYCRKIMTKRKHAYKSLEGRRLIEKEMQDFLIMQSHFLGAYALNSYFAYQEGHRSYDYRDGFLGNLYIQYFNSWEIISFGESEYL